MAIPGGWEVGEMGTKFQLRGMKECWGAEAGQGDSGSQCRLYTVGLLRVELSAVSHTEGTLGGDGCAN